MPHRKATRGQCFSMPSSSSPEARVSPEIRLWSREHALWLQILLSRSRDTSLFSLSPVMMRKQSSFDSHFLSTFFFSPRLSFVPAQTRTPFMFITHSFLRSECVWYRAFDVEQCETLLSVKLMPLCSPGQSVSVSLLFEEWDIWIVKSVIGANTHFNRCSITPRILSGCRTSASQSSWVWESVLYERRPS